MPRPMYCCLFLLLFITLSLFFGLFFGLNYPEIVRHGWPLTYCTILSSEVLTRYCCEASCNHGCSNAPSGSPQCGSLISQTNNGYSPNACAANSSACPPEVGSVCDGGYYCCSTCCSTCSSCSTSCSGGGGGFPFGGGMSCSTSCTTYSCNCSCCSSASRRYCTLSCPICFKVDLGLRYKTMSGSVENTTYTQEFKHDNNSASTFYTQHLVNSTSVCHYNPRDLSQVMFNTSFTAWKWPITAVFGILPLAAVLSILASMLLVTPALRLGKAGYEDMAQIVRDWNKRRAAKEANEPKGEKYPKDEDTRH